MQRKDPHIIHFQEFENLERDCQRLLGSGEFDICLDKLEGYLEHHGPKSSKQDFVLLQAEYTEIKKEIVRGIESTESYNIRRGRLNHRLLEFAASLKPPGYSNYEEGSLRRKSKWDERKNLTVYLQFDRDFQNLNQLFETLIRSNKWEASIPKVRYFMSGIQKSNWVPVPDDFDYDSLTDKEKAEISDAEPLSDNTAVRLKEGIEEITDENDKTETNPVSAEAIVEKMETKFQIWISAVGEPKTKCALVNALLEWFEDELTANGNSKRFTVCIPQAVGFRASESSPDEVSVFMKQPV